MGVSQVNYIPSPSDLLELSIHSFAEHAKELLGKHNEMTAEQRRELAQIGKELARADS